MNSNDSCGNIFYSTDMGKELEISCLQGNSLCQLTIYDVNVLRAIFICRMNIRSPLRKFIRFLFSPSREPFNYYVNTYPLKRHARSKIEWRVVIFHYQVLLQIHTKSFNLNKWVAVMILTANIIIIFNWRCRTYCWYHLSLV